MSTAFRLARTMSFPARLKLPVMLADIYMLDILAPAPLVTTSTTLGAILHDDTLPLGAVNGITRRLVCTVLVKAFTILLLVLVSSLYVVLLIAFLMTVLMLVQVPTCRIVLALSFIIPMVLHLLSNADVNNIVVNTSSVRSIFALTPCNVLESIDCNCTTVHL